MWEELKEKIEEKNTNGSPARVEWTSDGEDGEGQLTNINVNEDYVEFFIIDDNPEVGSFTLRSARNVLGVSSQDADNLNILSPYMGSITILHNA